MRRHLKVLLCAAALSAAAAVPALAAASILAYATNALPTDYAGPDFQPIKLTDAGATALTFTTTKPNQTVVIMVSLGCQVTAVSSAAVEIPFTVLLDAAQTQPIGSGIACGVQANDVPLGSAAAENQVATVATPGTHDVSVYVAGSVTVFRVSLIVLR